MSKATASTRAIVLSRENFGEADQYIQFFTLKWGLISALARSARKSKRRYVGGLDLFCHDEIYVRGNPRERPYLTELTVLNSFVGIRDHLEKLLIAGKVVHWVKRMCDAATPLPGVYLLLGQTLALIEREKNNERLDLLGLLFKLKLLQQLGLKPSVESCVRCGNPLDENAFFEWESGGTVCRTCLASGVFKEGVSLGELERRFLHQADAIKMSSWENVQLSADRTSHLHRWATQFATFHMHVRLPI